MSPGYNGNICEIFCFGPDLIECIFQLALPANKSKLLWYQDKPYEIKVGILSGKNEPKKFTFKEEILKPIEKQIICIEEKQQL